MGADKDFLDKTFYKDSEEYMHSNQIHDLFEDILRRLMQDRPHDPLQYLIDTLVSPIKHKVVILIPPTLETKCICEKVAAHNDLRYFNAENITSMHKKLQTDVLATAQQPDTFKFSDYEISREVAKLLSETDGKWLLEGFPKTHSQSYAFAAENILPAKVIALIDDIYYHQFIFSLRGGNTKDLFNEDGNERYHSYLRTLLEINKSINCNILQINSGNDENDIICKLNVVGSPASGKTLQGKRLAENFRTCLIDSTCPGDTAIKRSALKFRDPLSRKV
ncbi:hypothetical protein IE077_002191 [Cardiosporidium cionae]|uniref:Adenylate kinase 8 n=1 Tax=Cardiosporidium cionae TaxID=476202 RepID=A0ABQ7JBK7_9APIC|nr:hypothetical protein IE077_002191 [Cardiosporidium cionae]|eukprot:KAF8821294.1 hypothetical protein IE077_002191 [Cardiosporidium cionae]